MENPYQHIEATEEDKNTTNSTNNNDNEDLITSLLKSKGIIDPTLIKFEDESGEIVEMDFSTLSKQEQLAILTNSPNIETELDLDENEIEFLNELRTNDLTTQEYLEFYKKQAIQEYLDNSETEYQVAQLTDDELFIFDFKERYPDVSDDEIIEALDYDKENVNLFNKKIANLRGFYQEREKELLLESAEIQKNKEEQEEEILKSQIINSAASFANIGEFELDNDDREQVSNFLLGKDSTGTRHIAKALNEPDSLFKMGWFLLKGEEALSSLSDYYKDRITEYSKLNYQKGFDDANSGKNFPSAKVVKQDSRSTTNGNKTNGTFKTIHDLE